MNLQLTKRKMDWLSVLILASLFCGYGLLVKSCQSDNGFRVEHSARMGGAPLAWDSVVNGRLEHWMTVDTSKKPSPQAYTQKTRVYHNWKLEGSDTLFQMLWIQIQSPMDVTPRQLQTLKTWLQTTKIDSTK